jgi:hypothetical protein
MPEPNMNKQVEEAIVEALSKAVKQANETGKPDEAIVKAAVDAKFGPQKVMRMVEAFNVSKTLHHLKTAGDARAENFPIANTENIIRSIWPDEPETPAKAAAAGLHPDYLIDPLDNLVGRITKLSCEQIKLPPLTDKTAEEYGRDPQHLAVKAANEHDANASLLRQVESMCNEVFMRINGCVDKAAAYYRRVGDREPFDLLEKRAYATYGPAALSFLDMVYSGADLGNRRLNIKRASDDELGLQQMHFDDAKEPYSHVADAVTATRALLNLRKQASAVREYMHMHALGNIDRLPPQPVEQAIEYFLNKAAAHQSAKEAAGNCPGGKIRSGGMGRGAGVGAGEGPKGAPVRAKLIAMFERLKGKEEPKENGKKKDGKAAGAAKSEEGDQPDVGDYANKKACVVSDCVRCGKDHEVDFLPFQKEAGDWTYWGTCPETREPILMQIDHDEHAHAKEAGAPLDSFFSSCHGSAASRGQLKQAAGMEKDKGRGEGMPFGGKVYIPPLERATKPIIERTLAMEHAKTPEPSLVARGIKQLFGGPDEAKIEQQTLDEVFDPVHEGELQTARTQAMLGEFMSVDPVISAYDEDQVVDAYNQIVQMAPRAARQPAVMRGLLRKMLQQQDALEPFEAKEMVDIEKGLKSLSEPDVPMLSPMAEQAGRAGVLPMPGQRD